MSSKNKEIKEIESDDCGMSFSESESDDWCSISSNDSFIEKDSLVGSSFVKNALEDIKNSLSNGDEPPPLPKATLSKKEKEEQKNEIVKYVEEKYAILEDDEQDRLSFVKSRDLVSDIQAKFGPVANGTVGRYIKSVFKNLKSVKLQIRENGDDKEYIYYLLKEK